MTGGIIPGRIRIHQQAYMEPKTYVVKTLDRYASLGELHRASLLGDPSLREVVNKLTESSRNWSFIIDRMVRRIRCTRSTFLLSSHAVFRTMYQILNSAIPKCCYLEQSNLKIVTKYLKFFVNMSANASLSIDMVCRAFQLPSNMPPSRYLTAYLRTLVNVIFTYLIPRSLKRCYKCCVSQGAMHGVVYMHHQSWRTIVDKHRKDMLETSSFRGPLSEQEFVDLTDWGRVVAPPDVSVDLSALPQRVGACHAQLICKRSGCYRLLSSPKSFVCPPSVYPVLPSANHLSYLSVAQRLRCPGGLADFMRHLHTFLPSAFQPSLLSVPACLSSLCEFRDYSRKLGFTNFWVAKLDIEGFFDSIDHAQLRQVFNRVLILANKFTVFSFNTDFLTAELDNFLNKYIIQLGGQLFCQTRGIPQGSCISADLANLFLANTDRTFLGQYCWALDRTRKVLCKSDTRRSSPPVAVLRYLDDYLCLASSSEHLTCVVDAVKHGVAAVGLRLNSNKEKTNVGSLGQPVMWLGVEVRRDLSLLLPSISPFPLRSSRFKGYPRSVTACIAYLRRSLSQLSHFQFVCADRPKSHLHGCSSFHIGPPVSSCLKTHFANHTNASRLGAYAADVFWNVAKSCPQRSSLLSRNNSRRVALIILLQFCTFLVDIWRISLARISFLHRLAAYKGQLKWLFDWLQSPGQLFPQSTGNANKADAVSLTHSLPASFMKKKNRKKVCLWHLQKVCAKLPEALFPLTRKSRKRNTRR